jgi:hypothetical protein
VTVLGPLVTAPYGRTGPDDGVWPHDRAGRPPLRAGSSVIDIAPPPGVLATLAALVDRQRPGAASA